MTAQHSSSWILQLCDFILSIYALVALHLIRYVYDASMQVTGFEYFSLFSKDEDKKNKYKRIMAFFSGYV